MTSTPVTTSPVSTPISSRSAGTTGRTATSEASPIPSFVPGFAGLRCAACGTSAPSGPTFVCSQCFGPLESTYDLARIARTLTRESIAERPRTIWRYAELLPVDEVPTEGLQVGYSPLTDAPRLAERLGLARLWIKDDTRNPTLSFKDRVVAVAAARARQFGFHTLACASTGNLAGAVAGAASALGMRSFVLVPADLEAPKTAQAAALGGKIVRINGPYDAVNRLCLELTDELEGWAVVNVNLRPYYSEGSKTIAYEIAEQLGWRTPDVVVAPIASGSLYTKIGRGFKELAAIGLIDGTSPRFVGGQATGCGPVADAWARGDGQIRPVQTPNTIVRSLAIGNPADGGRAIDLAHKSGGSIEGVDDADTIAAIRLLAETEGILTETAGGVTLGALQAAIRAGSVGPDDEVVLVITGNGLKTIDALSDDGFSGQPGAVEPIAPSFSAFERWWEAYGQA